MPPSPSTASAMVGGPTVPTAARAARMAMVQAGSRAVGLVAVVLATALVARRLGSGYVDWATVLVCAGLVGVLLEPGVSPVVLRRLAVDHRSAPSPRAMLPVRLILGAAACAVVVVVAVLARGPEVLLLSLTMGAQVLGRSLVSNATSWLQLDQRLGRIAVLEAASSVLGLAGLALGLALDAPVAVLGALAFTLPAAFLVVAVRRELRLTPSFRLPSPGPQLPKVRSVIREAAPLALAIGLAAVYTRTSLVFVNRFEGDSRASQFFFAFLFAEQSIAIAGITAGAALPLLAARTRTTDLITDDVTHRLLIAITAVGVVGCATLLALADVLTAVIGGPTMVGAEHFIRLIAPTLAVIMPAMIIAFVYISIGSARRYMLYGAVGLGLNLLMNAVFVPTAGADASARITWATELLVTLVPLLTIAAASRSGFRAGLAVAAMWAASVTASELSATEVAHPVLVATLLLLSCLAIAHAPLRWLVQESLHRSRPNR